MEVGVKFTSAKSGQITGIRFYKGSDNTGTHVGNLWSASGTLLASATFTNETASGWQQVNFATPVNITAGTTYIASYHTNTGNYADTHVFFHNVSGPEQRIADRPIDDCHIADRPGQYLQWGIRLQRQQHFPQHHLGHRG